MGVNYKWDNLYYMFVKSEHIKYIDFEEILDSIETITYSNDGTKAIAIWMGNPPETILWLKNNFDYEIYTQEESMNITKGEYDGY